MVRSRLKNNGGSYLSSHDPREALVTIRAEAGGVGGGTGQFIQISGLAVDSAGLVYASDAFQSWVQVFSADGTFRETLGSYGSGVGQFMTPGGLLVEGAAQKLVVASVNGPALQVFRTPTGTQNHPPTMPAPLAPRA